MKNSNIKKGRALFFELIPPSLLPQPTPAMFLHGQRINAYGCSVPGLTRFTSFIYMGPGYQRHLWQYWLSWSALRKEFSLAIADFEYRVPLTPRLARPFLSGSRGRHMCLPSGQPQRVAPTNSIQILKNNLPFAIVKEQYGMSSLSHNKKCRRKRRVKTISTF